MIEAYGILGPYSKRSYVQVSDPSNPVLVFTTDGDAAPMVDVTPSRSVPVGRIPLHTAWTQSFFLVSSDTNAVFGDMTIDSEPAVAGTFSPVAGYPGGYAVALRMDPATSSSQFRCSCTIAVIQPTNEPPLVLYLSGVVGRELAITPGMALLPLSAGAQERKFLLRMLGTGTGRLDVSTLELPREEGLRLHVRQSATAGALDVTAVFEPSFVERVRKEKRLVLSFRTPDAQPARLTCQSTP
jgi:hypothetical protein